MVTVIFVRTVIVEETMERLRKNGKRIGTKWYKGEKMNKSELRPRWAYYDGAYFEWSDLKQDYICQIELPVEFFWKRYGISPYDKPMGCYRILYLKEITERYRRNKKKIPVVYCSIKETPGSDEALISHTIMEELKHEKFRSKESR